MNYWHEIVKSYDDPRISGSRRKDHGTLSQRIAVTLLMYLSFGTDYSVGIAKYFSDLSNRNLGKHYPKILTNSMKISSLLKKMREDKLILPSKKLSVRAAPRLYYVLNPRIIQTLVREGTYLKHDGTVFEIDLSVIKYLLGKMEKDNLKHDFRTIFFNYHYPEIINYFTFMNFIEIQAANMELRIAYEDNPWNPEFERSNSYYIKQISEYIEEMKRLPGSGYNSNSNKKHYKWTAHSIIDNELSNAI
jgi:hypothetical protein